MADVNFCAASELLLHHWGNEFSNTATTRDESASASFSHSQRPQDAPSHAAKSSPSPSFSAESSESYPLSRCSSISSLYSTATSTCESDSDDEGDDDKIFLVSILKKPRVWRRGAHSPEQQRIRNSNSNYASHNNGIHDSSCNDDDDDDDEWKYEAEEDDDEEDDDESECEIIFERNVSFNDPLATDIVTGDPVEPSPLSRLEWTASRARACLERERKEFERDREVFQEAWEEFEVGPGGKSLEEELKELRCLDGEDEEPPENQSAKMMENAYGGKRTEPASHGQSKRGVALDFEVENILLEMVEAAVRLVGQEQQRQQEKQKR
ncbi:hypothetical protein ONZ43_g1415 [Nemania bipapillata]|uniref:Uncharacterized protein n=1 Tax=Nemania bipapillata TaxID=110536 RepID=A0ACC2J4G7_9PEZI|nr:hypothetical protein ONZ43_g1415 [Nemania bipapillata]